MQIGGAGLDKKYIYEAAYIRSEEKKLIKNSTFMQMADMGSIDEIFKNLSDFGYNLQGVNINQDNYEDVLKHYESDLFEKINGLAPKTPVVKIIQLTYDYHNIKTVLKNEIMGKDIKDIEHIILPLGNIDIESIHDRKYNRLTENMTSAIKESIEKHALLNDPQIIDIICDQYCFKEMLRIAYDFKNKFIIEYIKLLIDLTNIKTFARAKKIGKSKEQMLNIWIDGGNIEIKLLFESFDGDFKNLIDRLMVYDAGKVLEESFEEVEIKSSFTGLEKLSENLLINYIKDAKNKSFSIDIIFAYLIAKEIEIKNIRILIGGKIAKISPDAIKERLRKAYE